MGLRGWRAAKEHTTRSEFLNRYRRSSAGADISLRAIIDASSAWVDGALAIDIMRVVKLEQHGYQVRTQTIPATVTPKNRLLLAQPEPSVRLAPRSHLA